MTMPDIRDVNTIIDAASYNSTVFETPLVAQPTNRGFLNLSNYTIILREAANSRAAEARLPTDFDLADQNHPGFNRICDRITIASTTRTF
jgi:hypothetical protein